MSEREDRERLNKLGDRLSAIHQEEAEKEQAYQATRASSSSVGIGMRIGIELIAATLAGVALGWFIDQKLGTKPIFMLAFSVLGFTAGVMDVLRIIKGLDSAVGYGRAVRDKKAEEDAAKGFRDDDED
ncbi:MAG: AtpZ/AtpI family protein [Rhodospirillaceae bacterium]|nr:AtpZ/AtpI family protein [Rhodospirillaceae bacterium]